MPPVRQTSCERTLLRVDAALSRYALATKARSLRRWYAHVHGTPLGYSRPTGAGAEVKALQNGSSTATPHQRADDAAKANGGVADDEASALRIEVAELRETINVMSSGLRLARVREGELEGELAELKESLAGPQKLKRDLEQAQSENARLRAKLAHTSESTSKRETDLQSTVNSLLGTVASLKEQLNMANARADETARRLEDARTARSVAERELRAAVSAREDAMGAARDALDQLAQLTPSSGSAVASRIEKGLAVREAQLKAAEHKYRSKAYTADRVSELEGQVHALRGALARVEKERDSLFADQLEARLQLESERAPAGALRLEDAPAHGSGGERKRSGRSRLPKGLLSGRSVSASPAGRLRSPSPLRAIAGLPDDGDRAVTTYEVALVPPAMVGSTLGDLQTALSNATGREVRRVILPGTGRPLDHRSLLRAHGVRAHARVGVVFEDGRPGEAVEGDTRGGTEGVGGFWIKLDLRTLGPAAAGAAVRARSSGAPRALMDATGDRAAAAIQARVRGSVERRRVAELRAEEAARAEAAAREQAALRIQAHARGKSSRDRVAQLRAERAAAQAAAVSDEAAAAVKLQAVARGRNDRRLASERRAREKAAVKLQAGARGKLARSRVQQLRAEAAEEAAREAQHELKAQERAAVRVQAMIRGNMSRSEVALLRVEAEGASLETEVVLTRAPFAFTLVPLAVGGAENPGVKVGRILPQSELCSSAVRAGMRVVEIDGERIYWLNLRDATNRLRNAGARLKATPGLTVSMRFEAWDDATASERRAARKRAEERELHAAVRMQAVARGIRDRKLVRDMRRALAERQGAAAVKLQATARGRRDRARAAALRQERDAQREAEAAAARAAESDAAVKVQALARGRADRRRADSLRKARDDEAAAAAAAAQEEADQLAAAIKIQSVSRGKADRKRVAAMRAAAAPSEPSSASPEEDELAAAIKIQAVSRGRADRRRVQQKRAEVEAERAAHAEEVARRRQQAAAKLAAQKAAEDDAAATKLQAAARGRRDRRQADAMRRQRAQEAKEAEEAAQLAAAIKIQASARGASDRRRVAQLRAEAAEAPRPAPRALETPPPRAGAAKPSPPPTPPPRESDSVRPSPPTVPPVSPSPAQPSPPSVPPALGDAAAAAESPSSPKEKMMKKKRSVGELRRKAAAAEARRAAEDAEAEAERQKELARMRAATDAEGLPRKNTEPKMPQLPERARVSSLAEVDTDSDSGDELAKEAAAPGATPGATPAGAAASTDSVPPPPPPSPPAARPGNRILPLELEMNAEQLDGLTVTTLRQAIAGRLGLPPLSMRVGDGPEMADDDALVQDFTSSEKFVLMVEVPGEADDDDGSTSGVSDPDEPPRTFSEVSSFSDPTSDVDASDGKSTRSTEALVELQFQTQQLDVATVAQLRTALQAKTGRVPGTISIAGRVLDDDSLTLREAGVSERAALEIQFDDDGGDETAGATTSNSEVGESAEDLPHGAGAGDAGATHSTASVELSFGEAQLATSTLRDLRDAMTARLGRSPSAMLLNGERLDGPAERSLKDAGFGTTASVTLLFSDDEDDVTETDATASDAGELTTDASSASMLVELTFTEEQREKVTVGLMRQAMQAKTGRAPVGMFHDGVELVDDNQTLVEAGIGTEVTLQLTFDEEEDSEWTDDAGASSGPTATDDEPSQDDPNHATVELQFDDRQLAAASVGDLINAVIARTGRRPAIVSHEGVALTDPKKRLLEAGIRNVAVLDIMFEPDDTTSGSEVDKRV